jgi:periplasmic protein TonB
MATQVFRQNAEPSWNWLRISGLSGSFGLHVFALILLALPVAIPVLKPEPAVIQVSFPERPPEPLIVEPPPPPVAPHIQRREVVQPVLTPRPVVIEDSVVAVPVTAPVSEIAEPDSPTEAVDVAPVSAAHASLAYESVTEVRYPMDSRRRGEQGTVVLRVLVGRDGLPLDIAVERSSGHRSLDRAAREAVLRWRFRPVQINGVNVQATGLVPVKFDINQG